MNRIKNRFYKAGKVVIVAVINIAIILSVAGTKQAALIRLTFCQNWAQEAARSQKSKPD